MTPPLFRDLVKRHENGFVYMLAHLGNGTTFYVEDWADGEGWIGWLIQEHKSQLDCTHTDVRDKIIFEGVDEFEAQMVLDHYVQTYGLL